MSSVVKTLLFVAVAAGLCLLATFSAPSITPPALYDDTGEAFFPEFTQPEQAVALEVVEYSADTAEIRPFRVERKAGRWTIPSHHGYAADAKEQMAKSAGMLIGLLKDGVRSDRSEDHVAFGVVDPKDPAADLEGRGTLVKFEDDAGNQLASLVIGKEVEGRDGLRYVRVPEKKRTYVAKLPTMPSTKFDDWIETDLLGASSYDMQQIVLDNYSIDEQTYTRIPGDILKLAKKDFDWTLEGIDEATEEVDEERVGEITSELAALKIVGVRQKPAGLTRDLTKAEGIQITAETALSLQGRGFFVTNDGNLYSNEGDLLAMTKKGVVYTLRFGEVLYGSGESVTAGDADEGAAAEGADAAEGLTANRFLMVTAGFDGSLLVKPEGTPLTKEQLDQRAATRTAIESIVAAIDRFRSERDALPESLAALTEGDEPFLPELVKDPWGNDFVLRVNDDAFAVASLGSDGAEGGEGPAHDVVSDAWAHEDELKKVAKAHEDHAKKVDEGKADAKKLMERFAPWYYVISDESFKKLHADRDALVKAKGADDDEESDEDGDGDTGFEFPIGG